MNNIHRVGMRGKQRHYILPLKREYNLETIVHTDPTITIAYFLCFCRRLPSLEGTFECYY